MDEKKTDCTMEDKTSEGCTEPDSIVHIFPSAFKIKEESEETENQENQEFLEDLFGVACCTDGIVESELHLGWEETESNISVNTLLDGLLEAENECCPPPLLVPKQEPDCEMCVKEGRAKPVTQLLVPVAPKEEPDFEMCVMEEDKKPVTQLLVPVAPKEEPVRSSTRYATVSGRPLPKAVPEIEPPDFQPRIQKSFIHDCRKFSEVLPNAVGPPGLHYYYSFSKEAHEKILAFRSKLYLFLVSLKSKSIQICAETFDTTFEEILHQGVVHDLMKIGTEKSSNVSMSSAHKHGLITSLSDSLKEKEIHKFNCSSCLQSFTSKYRLIQHVFMHIEGAQPPKYICKLCGEVFPSNHGVKQHLKMHKHDALSADNKCIVSDKAIPQLRSTTFNSLIDTGDKLHQFDTYGKPLTELGNHKKLGIIHSVGTSQNHDICGKSLNQSSNRKTHALTHSGKGLHKCDICGKSFSQRRNLKRHNLTHTGDKPHKCDICGKCFNQVAHLKNHHLIHTGIRPHKCDICGKSFTQVATLKNHHLIHTGFKPHKCDICGKSFTLLGGLKRHTLIHTDMRRHKCDICGKSFTRLSHLKRHSLLHV